MQDPALVPIAKEYGKTVAQILIQYTLQKVRFLGGASFNCRDGSRFQSRLGKRESSATPRFSIGKSLLKICRN